MVNTHEPSGVNCPPFRFRSFAIIVQVALELERFLTSLLCLCFGVTAGGKERPTKMVFEGLFRPEHKRKGWLFSDTKKGAQASAVVYSIVETAKANKLNPYKYLVHIFIYMPGLDFKTDPSLLEDFMP